MRIYELAKEVGMANKDLLSKLKEAGFEVSTHMSVATDDVINFVKKQNEKKSSSEKPGLQSSSHVKIQSSQEKATSHSKPATSPQVKPEAENVHIQKKQTVDSKAMPPATMQKDKATSDLQDKTLAVYAEPEAPAMREELPDFEQVEEQEYREQEKIKRLLTTVHFNTPGIMPNQQGTRRRRRRRKRVFQQQVVAEKKQVSDVTITASMPLFEVADAFGKQSSDLVLALLKKGKVCNRNHVLAPDVIVSLGQQFNIAVKLDLPTITSAAKITPQVKPSTNKGAPRWPVVVVMGHVDHGKTSLLDYIKKMNVASSEKGGITQHLRAWEADTPQGGKVVFLDTPGHEAFSYMRQRGSTITDIAILVIAADDGIMPQTIEALEHAKKAGVPIIVAINKIDKVSSPSAIETIKRQLAQHELMPADWGGQTEIISVSAKTGQGIDSLLEMIALQAEMMELKAEKDKPASAFVLESYVERGLGAVATVIVQEGVLKVGDYFSCGNITGKVRILLDSHDRRVQSAVPSQPVQVVGFDSAIGVGDNLHVVSQQEYSKLRTQKTVEIQQVAPAAAQVSLVEQAAKVAKDKKVINLIVKTDTRGSKEAVMGCIDKVVAANKEIKCPITIVNTGIGDITEGDVELAENTGSIILALHVRVEKNAQTLAKEKGIHIQTHGIIYELVDYLSALLKSKKEAVFSWNKVGEASVKKVFDIKGIGVIAGCYMREGVLARGNKVVCMRGNKQLGEAKVTSLQRDRKTVKEVHAGYECGFTADGFTEWQEGDVVVCYAEVRVE